MAHSSPESRGSPGSPVVLLAQPREVVGRGGASASPNPHFSLNYVFCFLNATIFPEFSANKISASSTIVM